MDKIRYNNFMKYERRVENKPSGYSSSYDLNCRSNLTTARFLLERYIRRLLAFDTFE